VPVQEVGMAESQIRVALEKLSQTIAGQPEKAKAKHSPATAVLMTGMKCRVSGPAGERIETDMPAAMGGAASGPKPGMVFQSLARVMLRDRDCHARSPPRRESHNARGRR